jgi:hypothetical protein
LNNAEVLWTSCAAQAIDGLSMLMPSTRTTCAPKKALPGTYVSAAWENGSVAQLVDEGAFIGRKASRQLWLPSSARKMRQDQRVIDAKGSHCGSEASSYRTK